MNINYINESVISVAVMRSMRTLTRIHTHTHTHEGPAGRGQCGKDVGCVSTKPSLLKFTAVKLAND